MGSRRAAVGAATVDFDEVTFDLKPKRGGQTASDIAEGALVELDRATAGATDQVMVMASGGEHIGGAATTQGRSLNDPQARQQFQRPVHRGASDLRHTRMHCGHEVRGSHVAGLGSQDLEDGPPRGGDPAIGSA